VADDFDETDSGPVDAGPPRPKGEGVRIIGAEEAAAALESGSARPRLPDDEPKYGDRPSPPDTSRARGQDVTPALSARTRPSPWGGGDDDEPQVAAPVSPARPAGRPLSLRERLNQPREDDDAGSTQPIDLSGGGASGGTPPVMPHWTEPPTGEVPKVLGGRDDDSADDEEAWAGMADRSAPRWRDQQADWEAADFGEMADLAEPVTGEPSDENPWVTEPAYDDLDAEPEPAPVRTRPRPEPSPNAPWRPDEPAGGAPAAPRSVPTAIATGLAFGAFALLMFRAGPGPAMALAVGVVGFAAVELFAVLRKAGYRPATLLGITSTVSVMLAAYAKGETAIPLVLALTMVCALLWFMFGVVRARPTMNVGVTLLGVVWVGFLGSFAALLLRAPNREGIAFLLGALIATIAYDVGAMFVGARSGRTPLAPEISPNKTWEGIMGGAAAALLASVLITRGIHPWDLGSALALGLVTAFMAPLGDLSQSLIKRDLGVKDMGTLLPGHGGVMDRFDALLFVLPATYYLVRLLQLA
jgi:phosphatidate cytidylyltransferase